MGTNNKLEILILATLLLLCTNCTLANRRSEGTASSALDNGSRSLGFDFETTDGGITAVAFDADMRGNRVNSVQTVASRPDLKASYHLLTSGLVRFVVFSTVGVPIPSTPGLITLNLTGPVKPIIPVRPSAAANAVPGAEGGHTDRTVAAVSLVQGK